MFLDPATAAWHRHHVHKILNGPLSLRGKRLAVWNYILVQELIIGTEFLRSTDGELFAVLGETHRVVTLPRPGQGGDTWFAYLSAKYGIGEREDVTRLVYDMIRAHIIEKGTPVELRRFAMVNQASMTAYVSGYNGRLYKLEGAEEVSIAPNGTDGVFFIDDHQATPCDVEIDNHGILLDRLTNLNFMPGISGLSTEHQKMALTVWLFANAFPDLLPHKPVLLLEGQKGSGKTTGITMAQIVLFGVAKPMLLERKRDDDFMVVLSKAPIALFDNVDSYIDWFPDKIAAYATGADQSKRKLYSNAESVSIKPHSFMAVTTRNPSSFRRDDVADRLLILRLERRDTFTSSLQIERGLRADRPRLLGEYLWYCNQIVTELRAAKAAGIEFGFDERDRMSDFAAFARIVAKVLGWTDEQLTEMFAAHQRERNAFTAEDDPLIDLLTRWLGYRQKNAAGNSGRVIDAFSLCAELDKLAQAHQIPWKETPRSLAQKLRSSHMEEQFEIEVTSTATKKEFCIVPKNALRAV